MAQKIHSSGFDSSIKGDEEKETKFINECKELFGINIDRSKMAVNKGKRTQSKLMLNNLCKFFLNLIFNIFLISGGRFSLRNFGLSQSFVTDDPAEFCEYKDDPSIDLSAVDELQPGVLLLRYVKKRDWIEEHDCSNVGKSFLLYLKFKNINF